jgi:hypothetical protein
VRQSSIIIACMLSLPVSNSTLAQGLPEQRRTELLDAAARARAQQDWPQAADLLQQIIAIRPTSSVRLALAGALLEMGRFQDAAMQSSICLQSVPTEHDLTSVARTTTSDTCAALLRQASSHLTHVTVETQPEGLHLRGARLLVDERPIDGFAVGLPFYFTPGRHRIRLASQGYRVEEVSENFLPGTSQVVRLHVTVDTSRRDQPSPIVETTERPQGSSVDESDHLPRIQLDLGIGGGFSYVSGSGYDYAQTRINADGTSTCGNFACYTTVYPGVISMLTLRPRVQVNLSRRVAISLLSRLQPNHPGWSVPPSGDSVGVPRNNPFSNLLLMGRVSFALSRDGWAARGSLWHLFGGVGYGQISPQVDGRDEKRGAHIRSGPFNLHAGVGWRYGFRSAYVGLELDLHVMLGNPLLTADATAVTGLRF